MNRNTPQQKLIEDIISKFRSGKIKSNVDLISEGFDVPDCECAILLRPTKSLTLYIQQSMRCMRYKPDKRAIIIDHVENYARFGMPDADRKWNLNAKKKSERNQESEEEVKVRQCPKCFYTFEPPAFGRAICPNCDYILKKITGFVLEYDSPEQCQNMQELQEYAQKHGYKKGWCYYQAKKMGWIV